MDYEIVTLQGKTIIEAGDSFDQISSEQDALDLVAICGENNTGLLLIPADNLSPDFFDLKTGLAGIVLLKFSVYHIKVAAVIPSNLSQQGKFHEMVIETNRGSEFRVFSDHRSAEEWLVD